MNRILTVLTCTFLFSNFAYAEYNLGIGVGVRSFNYAEQLTAPLKSTQSGIIGEVRGNLEANFANRIMYSALHFDYAAGNLEYDGSTQPPNVVPVTEQDTHSMYVVDLILGVNFNSFMGSGSSSDLILYAGGSYRTWNRNLSDPAEVYSLLSVPIGIRWMPKKREPFSFGIDVAWKPLVYGNVAVNFAPSTGYDTLNAPVNNTTSNFRVEVPVYVWTINGANVSVMPWYEQSDIAQGPLKPLTAGGKQVVSNGQSLGALEPSSHTTQFGADVMVEFPF